MRLLSSLSLAAFAAAVALVACGDDDGGTGDPTGGIGGEGGGDAGAPVKGGNKSTGGAGSNSGGTSGGAGTGNVGNEGGSTGGTQPGTSGAGPEIEAGQGGTSAGTGGQGGEAGAPVVGGSGGQGGDGDGGVGGANAGEGGLGGEGGGASEDLYVYNFESGTQGWATQSTGVTLAVSEERPFAGSQSLKVTLPPLNADAVSFFAESPPFWPGTVVTFHVWTPTTASGLYAQTFTTSNNEGGGNDRVGVNLVPGEWATIEHTVPNTFPGGLRSIGLYIGDPENGTTFPGGAVYVDAVAATGGTASCTGTGSRVENFEAGIGGWLRDETGGVTLTASAEETVDDESEGSMKVTFTEVQPPAVGQAALRHIYLPLPALYCGQTVTFNVHMPANPNLTVEGYTQYNNSDVSPLGSGTPEVTPANQWTQFTYTVPSDVGPGGIQRIGLLFSYTGTTPLNDVVYVDDVSWGN